MIQFFLTLRRLFLAVVGAWRMDPQFRSLMFLVAFTLLSGTLFYRAVEGWSAVDAFYFSVTTLTTVGLGDLTPATTIGKLFTVVHIFAGLGLIAGFINTVTLRNLTLPGRHEQQLPAEYRRRRDLEAGRDHPG
jgi:voltage-gated potassium channel